MKITKEILDACLQGKRSAQNELYKEVFSYLMSICIRYKNDYDSAGSSLNSIFLKILSNLSQFNNKDSFVAWMKRIAVNHLIDEYRKQKREQSRVSYLDDLSVSKLPFSIHAKEAELECEYLLKMIRELPVLTAKVFNLYAIDGFKHREIGELLEMSENTSKWHLSQARKKLQAKLELFNQAI
ncbi:MAG: RNA polymerase subunit sigma-70 [Verrucomicrobia bacterium]|nr:RNA polymerase subunit sigma-70 [Verrucomicrobiota bacterium]